MTTQEEFKKDLAAKGKVDWLSGLSHEFLWCFELSATAEQIWTHLSDTSRLNRTMGFGERTEIEKGGQLTVSTQMLGLTQEWLESPWTWVAQDSLTTVRTYSKGIAKKMQSVFYIDSTTHSDRRLVYIYFGWQPSNLWWGYFLKATASLLRKNFAVALKKIDQACALVHGSQFSPFLLPHEKVSSEILTLVAERKDELRSLGQSSKNVDCLFDLILHGDEMDLEPLRVLPISFSQGLDEQSFLITCLYATQLGVLKMSWDVICPHCRNARFSAQSLGDIPSDSSCDVCKIQFSTDEEESIEVLFHVHPMIREIKSRSYCAAEPSKKSHIKVQQRVQTGSAFNSSVSLKPGLYRARCIGQNWTHLFAVKEGGSEGLDLNGPAKSPQVAKTFQLKFKNDAGEEVILIVEDVKWDSINLKPSHVLALPEFREVFSEQHLNSNVKLYLGEQTVLFTDIVGSTKFYHHLGDAKAFAAVREHFQEVFAEVKKQRGVVVKTMGDSVMASFPSSMRGVNAAIAIQNRFNDQRSDTPIRLRVSVHSGPVIAVQLNTGLDYFGNTVNLAAKIQSCAGEGEIAILESVFHELQFSNPQITVQNRKNARDGLNVEVCVLSLATLPSSLSPQSTPAA